MTKLLNLQRQFAGHLHKKSDSGVLQEISGSKIGALARLNIYRNNVCGGFESVLSSNFSVTKEILGAEKFEQLLIKYCKKFPSKSGDLNEFGTDFPKFISRAKPSYLKDLARLELLHHQAYFVEKTNKKFDLKTFQKLPVENFINLIFSLDPTCFLLASKFAIFSIWQKKTRDKKLHQARIYDYSR